MGDCRSDTSQAVSLIVRKFLREPSIGVYICSESRHDTMLRGAGVAVLS